MSYAYATQYGWIDVSGHNVDLPDRTVSEAWVAGLSDEERAELGFVEVSETPEPTGVRVLGWAVEDVDGVPTRVWQTEPFSVEELVARAKAEARRRILARFPEWKQANMTARGVELVQLRMVNGAWTEAEQAEADQLQADWDWIKAVRAASNAIEAAIPEDPEARAGFDVETRPEWGA